MLRRTSLKCISEFNGHPPMRVAFDNSVRIHVPQTISNGNVHVTVASNGARIITHDFGGPISAVGVYNMAAGAKADPKEKPGLNYVLRCGMMLSNINDSMFQFDRHVRSVGASFEHQELRKQYLGWKLEVRRDKFQGPFGVMLNSITVPRFMEVEIDRYRDTMDAVNEELRWKQPRLHCQDQVEQVAFYKEPCGGARYVPPSINDDISGKALLAQYCSVFLPRNIVVVGVDIDHASLLAAYENAEYPHSASAPHFREASTAALTSGDEASQYQPGREFVFAEKRYKEMSTKPYLENETISALAWRAKGFTNIKEYATALVAQQLVDVAIGDGARVPSGLDRGIRSFYSPYDTAGAIGVTIRTDPKDAVDTLKKAVDLVQASASESNFKSAVQRAQVRFFHDNIELRRDYADFLAQSIGYQGNKQIRTPQSTLDAIRNVSFGDVKAAIDYSLGANPCLYVTGEVDQFPSLKQLGLKK
eukprot:PhF_6_TR22357/c0_g1_i1/m.31670/K00415/QCR2, UQCRC2; ubiquinol-cytochrome c reductase core subunit 2